MRKRMGKGIALLLTSIMVISTFLTGCSQDKKNEGGDTTVKSEGEASTKKVKLKMVTYLGNPTRDALIQEIVSKIDGVELEIISPPADQANQKIAAMLQSGESIDILELGSVPVNYITNGFIEPLDNYIKDWEDWGTVSEFLKDQLKSYDDSIYSVPYGVYERALFYRKDWLEEKNLKVPETMEELYETAVALTDKEQNRFGYSFRGGAGTFGFLQMTVLSHLKKDVIDIRTPFITKDNKSMYDNQEAVDALAYYKKLYSDGSHPDSIAWGYTEMVEAFYSGVTGMLIQDPEVITTCEQYMDEGTWDVAPLPVGPEGQALFPAGFAGWGIASSSKNKDLAWKVIEALSSVEGNTYFCKKNGNIPIHTTAQEDAFFSEGYYGCYIEMAQAPDKYVGYVDGGESRYATKEEIDKMADAGAKGDNQIQSMLLGKITPEQCAKELDKGFDWVKDSQWVKDRYK